MFIDTHAHVNFNAFKGDGPSILKQCLDADIQVINVGTQKDTSAAAVDLAHHYSHGVYAVVGLHPIHLFSQQVDEEETSFQTREEHFDYEYYRKLALDPKVVGIGECGLDYYRLPAENIERVKQRQKEVFIEHIRLAADTGKTLMIHCRDAYDDILEILEEYRASLKNVVIHSFIGSLEHAKKFFDLGCYVSFNGIITYKPRTEKLPGQSDPTLLDAVKAAPLERITLETDCPYLSPEPVRGTRNTPLNVKYVAQKIAELKGIAVEEVERQTTENAKKVFGI